MKVPISWLREYVDVEVTPEELAERLTFSGVEVEGIRRLGAGLEPLIVGEIVSFTKHPDADKLRLCQVNDGRQVLPVVCGATNFEVGDKAAFAPIGAQLPGGMRIEKRRVRGVESHGMLCAEDELGLSEDHGGILILDRSVSAGAPLAETLGLPDVVLELEITWNRPDCLSIIGMAREVAAILGKPLRLPVADLLESGAPVGESAAVSIEAPDRCPRYTARVLSGLTWKPSPLWMQHRLQRCGVRPISNIVDVTNYVMLECGQPLHAFDRSRLPGGRVTVRLARANETMTTLDGQVRRLTPDMLVIASETGPVALAGVMGGAGSDISAATRDVLLESASFDAPGTHRTSTALGLSTESSHRFERGLDPELSEWASRRATDLLVQLAGGTAARGVIDVYPRRAAPRRVTCRLARLQALLGISVPKDAVRRIFESLELAVESLDDEACVVRVPSFRGDLVLEADLIEEIARLHGLDQIPAAAPHGSISAGIDEAPAIQQARFRERLIGLGLQEILNYSFMSEKQLDWLGVENAATRLVLPNPVSSDHGVMRPALLPQMIFTLGHNRSRQTPKAGLFEIGRVYGRDSAGKPCEDARVAVGLMGPVGRGTLAGRKAVEAEEMFGWLKGLLETVVRGQIGEDVVMEPGEHPLMEPGWCLAVLVGGTRLGMAGLMRQALREHWRIAEPVGLAELALAPLIAHADRRRTFGAVPVYPSITHDIALLVPEDTPHARVVETIRSAAPVELTDITLFDIFKGKAVGDGRKSMAYSLVYRSSERTLTDEEANRFDEAIRQALRQALNAEIREG